ncbi:hypothetical protein Tco_0679350 [Tanacetum coccineum]|uniref:Uncharacterized protein n=1 Tax=Tanacetum coccineum TaxID=301880 RepID=A0ABQ4XIX5_9ASTR
MSMWIISRGVVLLILLMEYKVLRDFLLHRSSINNSARLSNKFGGFYFSFKFDISGLLHHVITTIAYRIRDKDTSQSKQNLQSSSMTFIHKTLIIPSVLDSCFISSTVSEVKRLIQFMHTTMVPEQVKIIKIQAGIQVSRPGELRRQLQLWKRFGRFYLIVFVLVSNIFPEVKGWLDEDLDNYHLKELRCSTQCHTQMSMWIISRGVVLLILLMLGISFKFDISGLLPHVITTIAYRIRDKDTSQSKQNLQSSSMTFIHKTLIIPSVLDSCFISSTVSEVKRFFGRNFRKVLLRFCDVELLLVTFHTQLDIFDSLLDDKTSGEHTLYHRQVNNKFTIEMEQLVLNYKKEHLRLDDLDDLSKEEVYSSQMGIDHLQGSLQKIIDMSNQICFSNLVHLETILYKVGEVNRSGHELVESSLTTFLVAASIVISFVGSTTVSSACTDLLDFKVLGGELPLDVSFEVDDFLDDLDSLVRLLLVFVPWFSQAEGSSS